MRWRERNPGVDRESARLSPANPSPQSRHEGLVVGAPARPLVRAAPAAHALAREGIRWGGSLLLCLGLAGCLSRPNLPSASFALDCPAPPPAAPIPAGPVLGLKAVTMSPLFEGRSLVYRLAENCYERDPYAEWLVTPERLVAAAVQAHLRRAGIYREVVDGAGVLKPAQWLELQVRELDGDFRQPGTPTAVLALKIIVYEPGGASPDRVVVEKFYRRQIPLSASTAAAVVGGWNQALGEIMAELAAELKAGASQPVQQAR